MNKNISITFLALGTVNTISVFDYIDESVIKCAAERVKELHQRLSAFNKQGDIGAINAAAGKSYVSVHSDTLYLVEKAKAYALITNGAFDPTIRPLVKLWDIGGRDKTIPDSREILRGMCLTNYNDIQIDHQGKRIMLRHQQQELDLGGIAKGYAADEVRRILLEGGVTNAFINLGGTVIVLGKPLTVGIQHPDRKTGISMGVFRLSNQAAVTSGSYEKFFIKDGRRYHHLLNPQTGSPADSRLKSVTIIGNSAMELDALSTAVFILGIEKGIQILKESQLQAIFITNDNQIFVTETLRQTVTLRDMRGA